MRNPETSNPFGLSDKEMADLDAYDDSPNAERNAKRKQSKPSQTDYNKEGRSVLEAINSQPLDKELLDHKELGEAIKRAKKGENIGDVINEMQKRKRKKQN